MFWFNQLLGQMQHWCQCAIYFGEFLPTATGSRGGPQPLYMPVSLSAPPSPSPRAVYVAAVPRPGNIVAAPV